MIECILAFSVQNRWLVLLAALAAALAGAAALTALPVDAVPDITNVQVQVNAFAPSLAPLEMEKQVTLPVEVALAGIPGLESSRSFSRNGFAQVTAVFEDGTDIYFARQQVSERLVAARAALPGDVDVVMGPVSTGLGEVYWWAVEYEAPGARTAVADGQPGWQSDGSYLTPEGERLTDDLQRLVYLRTVQDWIIRPQMRTVRGVAGADAIGGYVKEFQVMPDPARLMAYGIGLGAIVDAIHANNGNGAANYIERNGEGYVVRTQGRVERLAEIGDIPVATRDGTPIRVKDLAQVADGHRLRTGSASVDGSEAVLGTVLMRVGGNSRTVAAAADARIRQVNALLPPGIRARPVLNRTELVDATVRTVATNLALGALLVVLVLFLMLGDIRAAVITAMVIPLTMLITVAAMLEGRLSANLMSLGALDFGLIVDGAIIITENCLRNLAGRSPAGARERAALIARSANEVIKPAVYGQAVIVVVYVPLLSFTGVEGKTFLPMALTVIIALTAAFVLSLTFVPALLAALLGGTVKAGDNAFSLALKAAYRPVLGRVTARPAPVVVAAVVLVAAAGFLFTRLGQEFVPVLDEKNIVMEVKRIPSTSLAQAQAMQAANEKMLSTFPQVSFVFSRSGTPDLAADPMPLSATDTYIILKSRSDWPDPGLSRDALLEEISARASRLPGNRFDFSQPIQMRFNELIAGVREDLAIKVFGDEFAPMRRAAGEIAAILSRIRGAYEVKVEDVSGMPALDIDIDKAAISRAGLSLASVQDAIAIAVGGRKAGQVFEGDRRFDIVVRLGDSERGDTALIGTLPLAVGQRAPNAGAVMAPLRQFADFRVSEGPNEISRDDGKRRVVVTANVRGRDLGSLVAEAQARIAHEVTLPPGYWLSYGGQFENLVSAKQRLLLVVPACLLLIFLILLRALGSPRDALIVFSAVPLALTGGVVALWLRGIAFSISSAVGFIALSGVAVLNGLVMLTFIRELAAAGTPLREAIQLGALTRLRPVIMTALVASLGFVPMAIATGTGAEVQRPLATVVIGGLLTTTLLTLIVLPALHALSAGKAPAASPRAPSAAGTAFPATERNDR